MEDWELEKFTTPGGIAPAERPSRSYYDPNVPRTSVSPIKKPLIRHSEVHAKVLAALLERSAAVCARGEPDLIEEDHRFVVRLWKKRQA